MKYGPELRKLQLTILDILKEITRVCDRNGISYFIVAGTALGAVRHGGFIPWDDDLDIGMTRDNYNMFLRIAQNELPPDLFLQTVETDPESIFYFAKVRKSGTRFIEDYCKGLNMHQGAYVDIFPFDKIPNAASLRRKQYNVVNFWSNIFISKCVSGTCVPQKGITGLIKVITRKLLHFILKPVSKNYLYRKIDRACQSYNSIECTTVAFVKNSYLKIPIQDVEHTMKVSFEGLDVRCPGHVEDYLRHNYGDYLKLPPEDNRVGHRPYILEV